jgi:hypothetical protein
MSLSILGKAPRGEAKAADAASYVEQKRQDGAVAGAINVAEPARSSSAGTATGWKKAVDAANSRLPATK